MPSISVECRRPCRAPLSTNRSGWPSYATRPTPALSRTCGPGSTAPRTDWPTRAMRFMTRSCRRSPKLRGAGSTPSGLMSVQCGPACSRLSEMASAGSSRLAWHRRCSSPSTRRRSVRPGLRCTSTARRGIGSSETILSCCLQSVASPHGSSTMTTLASRRLPIGDADGRSSQHPQTPLVPHYPSVATTDCARAYSSSAPASGRIRCWMRPRRSRTGHRLSRLSSLDWPRNNQVKPAANQRSRAPLNRIGAIARRWRLARIVSQLWLQSAPKHGELMLFAWHGPRSLSPPIPMLGTTLRNRCNWQPGQSAQVV